MLPVGLNWLMAKFDCCIIVESQHLILKKLYIFDLIDIDIFLNYYISTGYHTDRVCISQGYTLVILHSKHFK